MGGVRVGSGSSQDSTGDNLIRAGRLADASDLFEDNPDDDGTIPSGFAKGARGFGAGAT